jgi:nucleoside-diphosphate-sugar epimerase
MQDLQVVFGAGALGRAVAQAALDQGLRVRIVTRSGAMPAAPAGAELVAADASDVEAATAASAGAGAIHHCAAPPYQRWATDHPALMAGILGAGERTGAVVVNSSNAYMYDPAAGDMTEASPETPRSRKGTIRAALDADVRRAHQAGRCPTVTVRAPDYYGPWGAATTVYGDRVFGRVLAGRRPQVFGRVDVDHTWVYVDDFAATMLDAALTPGAWGSTQHVASPPPLTQQALLDLIARATGGPARASIAPTPVLRGIGLVVPLMRELAEMAYQWEEPYRFRAVTPLAARPPTNHDEAVERTAHWFTIRP